jgi:tetratricopeptide (TPR) repeat protein
VSIEGLGVIQRDKDEPGCAENLREAFNLYGVIEASTEQGACAFNLGVAYMDVAALRDFDAAEHWLRQDLDSMVPGDTSGRGKTVGQLGKLSILRFYDALHRKRSEEGVRFINDAARHYQQALQLFPSIAIRELGITQNQLGVIYRHGGNLERALQHYQQSIRYKEQAGDIFAAGTTRYNVAIALLKAGRFEDARAYAKAALANFQSFGDRAAGDLQDAERLLALIDQAEAEQRGPS